MRIAIIFAAAVAMPLFAGMNANAASAGTLEFSVSADAATQEAEQKKKKPKSFITLILENVGLQSDSDQTFVVAAVAPPTPAEDKKGCPEAKDKTAANPNGAEEEDEKTPVGPEPLYFAF